jgi:hypothetical protein
MIYSIKKKLQNNYEAFWKINLNKCEKLRTYRKFKFIFGYETYISDIRNISHRNILAHFRTSNHKLHIETGRYTRPITPVENRICSNCNFKSVEDEIHFLMYCPKFENLRRELFSNVLNYNAAILSAEDKCVTLLELQLEHRRFSTGVIGRVYRPVSIWSLWLLVRTRVRMFLWLLFLISEI